MHSQAKVTLAELKECLQAEYIGDKKTFSWLRLFHRVFFCQRSRYLFWWRVAQYFYFSPHRFLHKLGIRIGASNNRKYCNDISLKTRIGKGLSLPHPIGIVLTNYLLPTGGICHYYARGDYWRKRERGKSQYPSRRSCLYWL